MYMLAFNVPESHVELVKNAIFTAGAGQMGLYSHCSWQTLVEGQFMPLHGSQAYIGEVEQLEKVTEFRVETVCKDSVIHEVIAALKKAHPYETPAYQVWPLVQFK